MAGLIAQRLKHPLKGNVEGAGYSLTDHHPGVGLKILPAKYF